MPRAWEGRRRHGSECLNGMRRSQSGHIQSALVARKGPRRAHYSGCALQARRDTRQRVKPSRTECELRLPDQHREYQVDVVSLIVLTQTHAQIHSSVLFMKPSFSCYSHQLLSNLFFDLDQKKPRNTITSALCPIFLKNKKIGKK